MLMGRGTGELAARLRGRTASGRPASCLRVKLTHLQACDLLLQPYVDGISGRRTTTISALEHAVPVVTTFGPLSEPFWRDTSAVETIAADAPELLAGGRAPARTAPQCRGPIRSGDAVCGTLRSARGARAPLRRLMRILIANWSCRRAGGTETYLGRIMSRLTGKGPRGRFLLRGGRAGALPADSAAGWRAARPASSGRSPGARHDSIVATRRHLCPRASRARDEAGCSRLRRRCSLRTRITAPASPVRRRTSSRSSVPAAGVRPACLALYFPADAEGSAPSRW